MAIKHNFTVKIDHSLCAGQQTGKKSTELFAFPWMMYKTHWLHKWTYNFTKQHEFFKILSSYPGKNIPKRKLNLTLHRAIDISGSYQQDKRRENEKQHMHYFITQVWGFLSKNLVSELPGKHTAWKRKCLNLTLRHLPQILSKYSNYSSWVHLIFYKNTLLVCYDSLLKDLL